MENFKIPKVRDWMTNHRNTHTKKRELQRQLTKDTETLEALLAASKYTKEAIARTETELRDLD